MQLDAMAGVLFLLLLLPPSTLLDTYPSYLSTLIAMKMPFLAREP